MLSTWNQWPISIKRFVFASLGRIVNKLMSWFCYSLDLFTLSSTTKATFSNPIITKDFFFFDSGRYIHVPIMLACLKKAKALYRAIITWPNRTLWALVQNGNVKSSQKILLCRAYHTHFHDNLFFSYILV